MTAMSDAKLQGHRKFSLGRETLVLCLIFAGSACLAQVKPTTLKVDVNNFVLYNYDTFDTAQFGIDAAATNVMMKTYNYHISIGDIVAVNGVSAKGTLLCTHTMFVLSPTAVGTIFTHGLFGGPPAPGAPGAITLSNMIVTGGTGAFLGVRGQAGQTGPWTPRVASVTEDPANRRVNKGGVKSIVVELFPIFPPSAP